MEEKRNKIITEIQCQLTDREFSESEIEEILSYVKKAFDYGYDYGYLDGQSDR